MEERTPKTTLYLLQGSLLVFLFLLMFYCREVFLCVFIPALFLYFLQIHPPILETKSCIKLFPSVPWNPRITLCKSYPEISQGSRDIMHVFKTLRGPYSRAILWYPNIKGVNVFQGCQECLRTVCGSTAISIYPCCWSNVAVGKRVQV